MRGRRGRGGCVPAAVCPGRGAGTGPVEPVALRLAERIRRAGPIRFSAFVEAALYGADGGFFTSGRGAGRAGGDFVTSPEVGPLFGALVARSLDGFWQDLSEPDPFVVVDAGAGRGTLARDVLNSAPQCASALRYVLVERSAVLRQAQRARVVLEPATDALGPFAAGADADPDLGPRPVPATGPIATALDELPAGSFVGVVIANELLDNLGFDVMERTQGGWSEVRVGLALGHDDRFAEVLVPAPGFTAPYDAPVGARLPWPGGALEWLGRAAALLQRGVIIVIDYIAPAAELVRRGQSGWLRTYRGHERGGPPLVAPGTQDVTADVALEAVEHAAARAGLRVASVLTQAEWLRGLGLDELVEVARRHWDARAHVGDLDAVAARSRVTEADALVDPAALGAHTVVVVTKGLGSPRQGAG